MFGRLLKHEFRASSGIMLLLSGIMLGIGAAAGLAVKFRKSMPPIVRMGWR